MCSLYLTRSSSVSALSRVMRVSTFSQWCCRSRSSRSLTSGCSWRSFHGSAAAEKDWSARLAAAERSDVFCLLVQSGEASF